jgi:hypothetical protein
LAALVALALASCAPIANAPAPATPSAPGDVAADDCAERGGRMQPVGRMQSLQCVIPYADGGRACSDGAQCASGRCIDEAPEASAGDKVGGVCQRTNFQFHCFATVSGGRRQATICVD